jgi:hypothetical protein
MRKFILAGFVLIMLCCSKSPTGIYQNYSEIIDSCIVGDFVINSRVVDSIYRSRCFKEVQLLGDIIFCGDTCVVNSTSLFTDYPFGAITNIYDFKQMFLQNINLLVQDSKIKGTYNVTLTSGDSQVSVLFVEIFRNLFQRIEIINANIVDTGIILSENIQIGISKTSLIETFPFIPYLDLSKVKVIEFKSDFSRNNIYFSFDTNDILIKIEISSPRVVQV